MMTAQEFNRDFWIIYQDNLTPRTPISFFLLQSYVGYKIFHLLNKLEQFQGEKFVWKPFHGTKVIIYRH